MIKYDIFNLLPEFETNTYLVYDIESLEGIIIDPSAPSEKLLEHIYTLKIKITAIINTHGHADHIGGNSFFHKHLSIPIWIHEDDACMLNEPKKNLSAFISVDIVSPNSEKYLKDNDIFTIGKHIFKVIHTPGHTKGSICLYTDGLLFSGDTLFSLDIGRTDLPGGNHEKLLKSIKQKLFILPAETLVLPGHEESSNIRREIAENPWFS